MPVLDWLQAFNDTAARNKAIGYIEQLANQGHRLSMPHSKQLGNGLHELRPTHKGVCHRIIYFFHGPRLVILAHGFAKEAAIPPAEIVRALGRKARFEANPANHNAEVEL